MSATTTPRGAVLGIDVGTVRVGVAASDATRTIATPVATLQRRDRSIWDRIRAECEARDAALLVIGLPRRLDGGEGDSAADAHAFAAEVARRTGVATTMWDERFTTAAAERTLISAGMRRRRRREVIDSTAAALLLQSWLDAQPAAV